MRGNAPIYTERLFTSQSISASANATSNPLDLRNIATNGFFSVQYTLTGTGTAKIEYNLSNEDAMTNLLEPTSAADIASGLTATSGPGADGKDVVSFAPELARWLRIKVTETGGANAVVMTLDLAVQ